MKPLDGSGALVSPERKIQRCRDCGGIIDDYSRPVILGRCNTCHEESGPLLSVCPKCRAEFKTLAGVCLRCSVTLTPINRHLIESPSPTANHESQDGAGHPVPLDEKYRLNQSTTADELSGKIESYRSGYSCGYSDAKSGSRMRDKDAACLFYGIEGVPDVFADAIPLTLYGEQLAGHPVPPELRDISEEERDFLVHLAKLKNEYPIPQNERGIKMSIENKECNSDQHNFMQLTAGRHNGEYLACTKCGKFVLIPIAQTSEKEKV